MSAVARSLGLAAFALLLGCAAWAADRCDIIVVDHFLVKSYTYPEPWGGDIGAGFASGLIVNTGTVPITVDEIWGLEGTCGATSVEPPGRVRLDLLPAAFGLGSDLLPGQAVGTITGLNDTLLTFLQPGEVLRDTGGSSAGLGWGFEHELGYAGSARFDVTATLGGQVIQFAVQVDVQQVAFEERGLEVLGVTRLSSGSVPTARTTWGRLKALYR